MPPSRATRSTRQVSDDPDVVTEIVACAEDEFDPVLEQYKDRPGHFKAHIEGYRWCVIFSTMLTRLSSLPASMDSAHLKSKTARI